MATAIESDKSTDTPQAPVSASLCRAVDFISGQATPTFLANPAKQDELFARARAVVGSRPGHWDIQWRDDAVPSGWSRAGLSFTVASSGGQIAAVTSPAEPAKGCPRCEIRDSYDSSVCAAAAKLGHAGVEYLATEIDWAQALTQYSGYPSELIEFIESLAVERDYDAVQVLVNRFYSEPRASFSDERI